MKLKNILKSSLIAIALSASGCQLSLIDEINNSYREYKEKFIKANSKYIDNKSSNIEDISEIEYLELLSKYKNPNRFIRFARN